MNDKVICLNDNDFEQKILREPGVYLVDFWAEWCNPCKKMSDILSDISNIFDGKLIVAKLNIDKNPISTAKYCIRSVPSLLLFRNGNILATKTGSLSKEQLEEFLFLHL